MRNIDEKCVELSRICHGYKEDFYFLDKPHIRQTSENSIEGKIAFKPPAYARLAGNDILFNSEETIFAFNQIAYLLTAIVEVPHLFDSNASLEDLELFYMNSGPKFVIRDHKISYHKPIYIEKENCSFWASINKVRLHPKSGYKFMQLKAFLGNDKNFEVDSNVVLLKHDVHRTDYI